MLHLVKRVAGAVGPANVGKARIYPVDLGGGAIGWFSRGESGAEFSLFGLTSFNGRTGPAISPIAGDYSAFFQPIDSDLTAIAALATTGFGRNFLTLADAVALAAQVNTRDTVLGANVTLGAVTTEQQCIARAIPANTLLTANGIRFTIFGVGTQSAAAVTFTPRIRIGTTTLAGAVVAQSSIVSPATARTNASFMIEGLVGIRAVGAGGSALGGVDAGGNFFSLATLGAVAGIAAPVAIDFTQSLIAELTLQRSAATFTGVVTGGVIEIV